jgi:hypothetical protein
MFGMMIVSFCGVALPIATGVWLAPASEERNHAAGLHAQSKAGGLAPVPAHNRRARPESLRQSWFPTDAVASSPLEFRVNPAADRYTASKRA